VFAAEAEAESAVARGADHQRALFMMPIVSELLSSIPADVAHEGVPTVNQLRDQFQQQVSKTREENVLSRAINYLATAPAPGAPQTDFTDPVQRIDYYLSANQLGQAIKEAESIDGGRVNNQSFDSWLRHARDRERLEQVVQVMRLYSDQLINERQQATVKQ
jgi:hypothetical protein